MFSCVAAVEALRVDDHGGAAAGAVKQQPFIVRVLVLGLHVFLQDLIAPPQRRVLDPLDL